MKSVIYAFLKFLWLRDSISACCLIIVASSYLEPFDVKQLRDYFQALYELELQELENAKRSSQTH